MLYQKLLMGERPYFVKTTRSYECKGFENHRHPEIELYYCIKGTRSFIIDKERYNIHEGDLLIIGSMQSHELLAQKNTEVLSLVINVGPFLLGRYFEPLAKTVFPEPVLHLNTDEHRELIDMLQETALAGAEQSDFSELVIRGNLYKICAYILKKFISSNTSVNTSKALRSVSNIEKALEHIYAHYNKPLSVENVALLCGYSKSNFCKIFKNITGETFHSFLNSYRLRIACQLLSETNLSLEEIAVSVGLADSKTLCRIFKLNKGITPGEFRKLQRQ